VSKVTCVWSVVFFCHSFTAEGNGDLQTLICVLVARPRRCLTLLNSVPWQNWMAAYLGYTLRMRTLFRGWPIMVNDTHTRRRRLPRQWDVVWSQPRPPLFRLCQVDSVVIIVIKNECHTNIIVDRLQGCSHSKKLREGESESCSSTVVWQAVVRTLEQFSFQAVSKNVQWLSDLLWKPSSWF